MPHDKWGSRDVADPTSPFHPFPTPFDQIDTQDGFSDQAPDHFSPPYSLQEIDMLALSYEIRQKPDWARKLRDSDIRTKWRAEALGKRNEEAGFAERTGENYSGYDVEEVERPKLTEKMVDYVLDELELHAEKLNDPHGIQASCFEGVYESDSLVPKELLDQLLARVSELEKNPPFGEPDWHPGSDDQVLDLVHPSLFPLRYGVTPVRQLDADGKISSNATPPEPRNALHSTSKKYQWLPSDFDVDEQGKVTISSYINNLHPKDHASFYPVLASIFERFVPAFERVLSDLQKPPPRRILIDHDVASAWYGEMPDNMSDEEWDEWEEKKVVQLPEPEPFKRPEVSDDKPAFPLRGRKLQVIVKLANIHLTPEKPEYGGGVWHVEGMQNEEIVASGIYYYDQENIGESRLAYRGTFDDQELPYEQSDVKGVKTVFGIDPDGPCMQYYNSARTCAGRSLFWPNIYQHRVSRFSLADRSKPGYRKILVFFLVDPLKSAAGEVISTARVPYQQREWAERELPHNAQTDKMPVELWNQVLGGVEGLMTYEEAKKVREDLMHERKFLVEENTEKVFERSFSLCEH
ncbi:DUF4246 domain-containing protein [Rhodotorula paludigena]|uniref:DUF4246 domain-containing protein n=1 Tax=Rhodotorula paludigena TaxID=86838 RepID=UPI0031784A3B